MFVLHADADAFFASVGQRDDPRLRGRPVIVGGGVVLAASYEAKAYGIRTAMGGRQARRLCPDAIVVRPRHEAYTEASRAMLAVFEDTSPVVEGLSIDEAFLDVRGMERIAGTPLEIAVRLRAAVRERVGLPVTVGIARSGAAAIPRRRSTRRWWASSTGSLAVYARQGVSAGPSSCASASATSSARRGRTRFRSQPPTRRRSSSRRARSSPRRHR